MPRSHSFRWIQGAAAVALGWSVLGACSNDDDGSGIQPAGGASSRGGNAGVGGAFTQGGASGAGAAGASGDGGSSANGGASGAGGGGGSGAAPACKGLPFDLDAGTPADSGADSSPDSAGGAGGTGGACTGASQEVERIDVDLVFVMDSSVSMNEKVGATQTSRWDALKAAMEQLAQAPQAASLQAGIVFYSAHQSTLADDPIDCNPASYSTPAVPIGALADVGDDIVRAIGGRQPGGLTPIVPAMKGAVTYATQWAQSHPARAAAIVLVSDGYPTQCSRDPGEVAATAQAAYAGTPSVRTFIIGVGANTNGKLNLDNYARSGATQTPFLVDDGNITQSFVDTVLNIAAQNLSCDFTIPPPPPGQQLQPDKVQVVYTPANGPPEEIPKLNGEGECSRAVNGGFYFDNPTNPKKIFVCGCTCSRFGAGRVDVRFGCRPRFG